MKPTDIETAWTWANRITNSGRHRFRVFQSQAKTCNQCGHTVGYGLQFTPMARNRLFAWIFQDSVGTAEELEELHRELEAIALARNRVQDMADDGYLSKLRAEARIREELLTLKDGH